MINLSQKHFLAAGTTRSCYLHPTKPDRCIKIDLGIEPGVTSHKEVRYFEKLKRIRPKFDYVPIARCYGWLETNQGMGTEHDLILNETDQQCSETLYTFLKRPQTSDTLDKIRVAFDEFVSQLMVNCIPIRDMNHKNLCIKKLLSGKFQLVAVDGVGHTHLVPIVDYWRWFARKRIRGYLDRFELSQAMFDQVPILDSVALE